MKCTFTNIAVTVNFRRNTINLRQAISQAHIEILAQMRSLPNRSTMHLIEKNEYGSQHSLIMYPDVKQQFSVGIFHLFQSARHLIQLFLVFTQSTNVVN